MITAIELKKYVTSDCIFYVIIEKFAIKKNLV